MLRPVHIDLEYGPIVFNVLCLEINLAHSMEALSEKNVRNREDVIVLAKHAI